MGEEWEGEKTGGLTLADDSVNGVITGAPLSLQHKRKVSGEALFQPLSSVCLLWVQIRCFAQLKVVPALCVLDGSASTQQLY